MACWFPASGSPVHFLTVPISDGGSPPLSTNTFSVNVCDLDQQRRSCSRGATAASAAAVLTCVLILLGVFMVTVIIKHRRTEPLMMNDEPDVRENIVRTMMKEEARRTRRPTTCSL